VPAAPLLRGTYRRRSGRESVMRNDRSTAKLVSDLPVWLSLSLKKSFDVILCVRETSLPSTYGEAQVGKEGRKNALSNSTVLSLVYLSCTQ